MAEKTCIKDENLTCYAKCQLYHYNPSLPKIIIIVFYPSDSEHSRFKILKLIKNNFSPIFFFHYVVKMNNYYLIYLIIYFILPSFKILTSHSNHFLCYIKQNIFFISHFKMTENNQWNWNPFHLSKKFLLVICVPHHAKLEILNNA